MKVEWIGFEDYNVTLWDNLGKKRGTSIHKPPLVLPAERAAWQITSIVSTSFETHNASVTRMLTLSEAGLSTGGLAEDGRARAAEDNGLGVREDGGDVEASCGPRNQTSVSTP